MKLGDLQQTDIKIEERFKLIAVPERILVEGKPQNTGFYIFLMTSSGLYFPDFGKSPRRHYSEV